MASNTFLKKELLSSSWSLYKKHAGILVLMFVISLLVTLASYGNRTIGWGVPSFLFSLLSMFVTMANIVIVLSIVRGTYTTIKAAFTNTVTSITPKQFLVYIITSILYGVMVGLGGLLLIVPGVIFALMFMFYGLAILDENLSVFKSLSRSQEITKGHRWNMFLMGLIIGLLVIVSAIPFGVGLFITVPLATLVMVSMYTFLKKNYAETPVVEVSVAE